ncbi:MAG: hypothetical protein JWR77_2692 [Rhizorhabdus sp.]|nr:hypothetical protein [Rhizorhabdus sp.]
MSEVSYDKHTPVTAHDGLAAAVYGEVFTGASSILNVAGGNTDLQRSLHNHGIQAAVTAVDPAYARPEYQGKERFVAGYAQRLEFADESFDMTMCQFGIQHIPDSDIPAAINEMVRVTKPAETPNDCSKGLILINPVFNFRKMSKALAEANISDNDVFVWHHSDDERLIPKDRRSLLPTLVIHKTTDTTPEMQTQIAKTTAESGALKPMHRSVGEIVSRLVFQGRSRA